MDCIFNFIHLLLVWIGGSRIRKHFPIFAIVCISSRKAKLESIMSIRRIISAFTTWSSVDSTLLFPSPIKVILPSLFETNLDYLGESLTASLRFFAFSFNWSCNTSRNIDLGRAYRTAGMVFWFFRWFDPRTAFNPASLELSLSHNWTFFFILSLF